MNLKSRIQQLERQVRIREGLQVQERADNRSEEEWWFLSCHGCHPQELATTSAGRADAAGAVDGFCVRRQFFWSFSQRNHENASSILWPAKSLPRASVTS